MGIDFSGTEIELTIPGSTAYATSTFSAVSGYPEKVKSQVISFAHAHLHYCFQRLSTDNGPLYRFHQRLANFRLQEVTEIKTVPYVPLSHPFVERLIGTLRRECLDRTLFWTATDLQLCE